MQGYPLFLSKKKKQGGYFARCFFWSHPLLQTMQVGFITQEMGVEA